MKRGGKGIGKIPSPFLFFLIYIYLFYIHVYIYKRKFSNNANIARRVMRKDWKKKGLSYRRYDYLEWKRF